MQRPQITTNLPSEYTLCERHDECTIYLELPHLILRLKEK